MILHRLMQILSDYAGFGPGIVVSLVVSLVMCGYAGRRLETSRVLGWSLVMSLGIVLSATITPSREALMFGTQGSGTCDLSTIGPGSWWALSHLDDISLNVLLFVPLGLSIGWCPRSRARLVMVGGAFVLPVAIELLQLLVVSLGRKCQTSDVVDNLTGLGLGLVAGSVARRVWTILDQPRA